MENQIETLQKRKPQTSIAHEYRDKNPKQHASKNISQYIKKIIYCDRMPFFLRIQGGFKIESI